MSLESELYVQSVKPFVKVKSLKTVGGLWSVEEIKKIKSNFTTRPKTSTLTQDEQSF